MGLWLPRGAFYILARRHSHLRQNSHSGLDAIGRVWDLRTGRTAMVLDGHVQAIFAIAFSPNGLVTLTTHCHSLTFLCLCRYQIATGAGDDTIRIWDMRSLKALYTIPAHLSNVSDVRFFRGNAMPTKSIPGDVAMNGAEENEDSSHDITDADLEEWKYRSGLYLASSGYDGLVKMWSADDWQLLRTLSTDAGKVMSVDLSSNGRLMASGTYNRNFQLFSSE